MHLGALVDETRPDVLVNLATAFAIASYIGACDVRDRIVKRIIDTGLSWQAFRPKFEYAAVKMPSSAGDCSKLVSHSHAVVYYVTKRWHVQRDLLDRRKEAIESRRRSLGMALMTGLGFADPSGNEMKHAINAAYRI